MTRPYPRMTRAHFLMIASVMSEGRNWSQTVKRFADELAKCNPAFNRRKFIKACEVGRPNPDDIWE